MANTYDTPTYKDQGILVAPTLANLRLQKGSMRSTDNNVAVLLGATTAFDQALRLYSWDSTSAAAESLPTVVAPTGVTTGRWRSP